MKQLRAKLYEFEMEKSARLKRSWKTPRKNTGFAARFQLRAGALPHGEGFAIASFDRRCGSGVRRRYRCVDSCVPCVAKTGKVAGEDSKDDLGRLTTTWVCRGIIKRGGLVAFSDGDRLRLGANALDRDAVARIFAVNSGR